MSLAPYQDRDERDDVARYERPDYSRTVEPVPADSPFAAALAAVHAATDAAVARFEEANR